MKTIRRILLFGVALLPMATIPGAVSSAAAAQLTLAQIPQCAGVTEGVAYTIDASRGIFSVEPPAGFDPITASDAALACYGFPSRPDSGPALAHWQGIVRHAEHYVVPVLGGEGTAQPPQTGTVCNGCSYSTWEGGGNYPWSGYSIPASKNGWNYLQWTEVNGEWSVPYGHTYSSCHNSTNNFGADDSPWVGLGGDSWDGGNGNALIQAGTDTMDLNPVLTRFFWEDYPNAQQWVTSPAINQGDRVYVNVHYTGASSSTFYYLNYTTDTYASVSGSTPYVDLSSAEAINEDLKESWSSVNFGSVELCSPEAFGTWGSNYQIQKLLSDSVTLGEFTAYTDSTLAHKVAYPGAIDTSGDFTDYAVAANDAC